MMDTRISLAFKHRDKLRFVAVAEPAAQAKLVRLLTIAHFILQHPKLDLAACNLEISGGLSGETVLLSDIASLQLAHARIGAIGTTDPRLSQGSSLGFEYFDQQGRSIPQPDFDSIEAIFSNLNGQRTVPSELVDLMNGLDG